MRYLLRRRIPNFDRVLFVESGARELTEKLLPTFYKTFENRMQLDLITCYPGQPTCFRQETGQIYRVTDYQGADARSQLYKTLANRNYTIIGIICSDEPIMTKWKWVLAARIPAKLFILNENGDYFWVDYRNWKTIRHFLFFRTGLAEAGAVRTLIRIALFPFTLTYLLTYAATVHLRRAARS